jgi:hypothetical protein
MTTVALAAPRLADAAAEGATDGAGLATAAGVTGPAPELQAARASNGMAQARKRAGFFIGGSKGGREFEAGWPVHETIG